MTRVDRNLAPRAHPSVFAVDVDDETVLYDERTGRLHALNSTAAVIWSCCDGELTLGELLAELRTAYGAPAAEVRKGVYAVVRQLVEDGLLLDGNDDGATVTGAVRPSGTELGIPCVPCVKSLGGQSWAGSVELRVGDLQIVVRGNTDLTVDAITATLAPYVVGSTDGAPHYSLFLADKGEGATRELHRLYRAGRLQIRARRRQRAVLALVSHLGAHLDDTVDDRVMVTATAAVRDGRAVLLGPDVVRQRETLEPRLNRRRIVLHDAPSVAIEDASTVALTELALRIDEGALAPLADRGRAASEPAQPKPGPRQLCGWIVRTPDGTLGQLDTPPALAAVMRSVRNLAGVGADAALDLLAQQARAVPVVAVGDAAKVADDVAALLDGGGSSP